ncbi:MAG: tail fiber protein [Cytophagales bacterium]|nr:tail fiber protein [Cytophagales bacterium]
MDGTLGEIRLFSGIFAPRNWAFCDGQLLSIKQKAMLFSLIGTTYGGDGRTTFGLPDLRGRTAVSHGTGPGLTTRTLGRRDGEEVVFLTKDHYPSHTHKATFDNITFAPKMGIAKTANRSSPEGAYPADAGSGNKNYVDRSGAGYGSMASALTLSFNTEVTVDSAGVKRFHNNLQPFLVLNYIICLDGVYPKRS